MKQIIALVNQKGGVGKSTTAHALGCGIFRKGYRVLFVDLDPQGNLTYAMAAEESKYNAADLLRGVPAKETVITTRQGDIVPAGTELSGADITLTYAGKEFALKKAIEPLLEEYDYIFIDTPPAMGILSINAMTCATQLIIPVLADIFSLQGMGQLYDTYSAVKEYTNPELRVLGVLLTKYNDRMIISRNIRAMAQDAVAQFQSKVFTTSIREAVAIRETQISQQDLFSYAPESRVAQDYAALIEEVLQ